MITTLVLASQSPRRRDLLGQFGLPMQVMASGVSEEVDNDPDPVSYVSIVARRKAEFVATLPQLQALYRPIVVAADTTVVIDGQILGKPESADDAFAMLQQLRGRDHLVHTGFCLLASHSGEEIDGVHTAIVTMRNYSDDEIRDYIATGDPMDKAGSYGIQHPAFRPVDRLDGCFLGVMGLSLCQVISSLGKMNVATSLSAWHLAALHEGYECPIMPRHL